MRSRNTKVVGLLLSFAAALCVVVPGTLAAETDTDVANNSISVGDSADQNNPETPIDIEAPLDSEKVCTRIVSKDGTPNCIEDCPVYEVPAPNELKPPKHIDGCRDECDGIHCECECHKSSLFNRLMKSKTYAELMEMIESTPEKELMALTSEQVALVEEKILALEPQPLPEIIIEETDDEPVVSEIIYPTVNFDHVAPFGAPVIG